MNTIRVVLTVAVLSTLPFNGSRAASFDCTKAKSRSEVLICSDSELSALDDELGVLYKHAKALVADKAEFVRSNRGEWKSREATCLDKACLLAWYARRRVQLSEVVGQAEHSPHGPKSDALIPPSHTRNCTDYESINSNSGCSIEEIHRAEEVFADRYTQWFYSETPGAGTNSPMLAFVYSLNKVSLAQALDYSRVKLSVVQGEGYKLVSISADPGRLRCIEPDCPVAVRFDQGPLRYFSANGGAISLTLVSPDSFLTEIRLSKRAYIVFPLEDLGNVTFEFDVSDYKW